MKTLSGRSVSTNIALGIQILQDRAELAMEIKQGVRDLLATGSIGNTVASISSALQRIKPNTMSTEDFYLQVGRALKDSFGWGGGDHNSLSCPANWNINQISESRSNQVVDSLFGRRSQSEIGKAMSLSHLCRPDAMSEERANQIANGSHRNQEPKKGVALSMSEAKADRIAFGIDPGGDALSSVPRQSQPERAESPLSDLNSSQESDPPSVFSAERKREWRGLLERLDRNSGKVGDWRLRSRAFRLSQECWGLLAKSNREPPKSAWTRLKDMMAAVEAVASVA
jgi:hypothetical protein